MNPRGVGSISSRSDFPSRAAQDRHSGLLCSCGTPFFVSARKAREPLHRIAMHLHAERFREFLSFIEDIAREDAGKTVPGKAALMRRRRGRATFQLDRCYLFVGCMVHSFGNDAELLLFALLFVTVGCTNLRNVRVATATEKDAVNDFAGVFKYIRDLWADDDIDTSGMVKHWGDKRWRRKAYDTTHFFFSRSGSSWIEGFCLCVKMWQAGFVRVLHCELYRLNASTDNTLKVLEKFAGLPPLAAMQMARCLALWDATLYDPDRDYNVRSGALPVADFLDGVDCNWNTFTRLLADKKFTWLAVSGLGSIGIPRR